MGSAQLVGNDAAWHYFARAGRTGDWPMWWVFENTGAPPARDEIAEYLTARTDLLTALRRRIVEVPGGLGHPFWVVDDSPLTDHLTTHDSAMTWSSCLDRVGAVLARPLDARDSAWTVHVFTDVSGAPTVTGSATVVLMYVSHALIAGPSMTSLSEAMFADIPQPLHIEGLGPAVRRAALLRTAIANVLRMPRQIQRFNASVRAENQRIEREADDAGPHTPARTGTVFNQRAGDARVVRTIPVPVEQVRKSGITVTAAGLTAISRAMERYLAQCDSACPADLAAFVTIAVPEAEVMGVNRIGANTVELFPDTADLAERARAIDACLRSRKVAAASPRELTRLANAELLPSRTFRARYGAYPPFDPTAPKLAHTTLTSIKCAPSGAWSLAGNEFRFAGMLPPVYPDICLAQSFVGVDGVFTLSVASDPALIEDLDTYCALLTESIREVAAVLTTV